MEERESRNVQRRDRDLAAVKYRQKRSQKSLHEIGKRE